ncbi:MAG: molecular chaperone TorD family protein [Myxococcota bacterium]|jgi:TorA maturation chaperone TorD
MTAPRPPPLDATLPDDLAALAPKDQLRLAAFRLFSRLLDDAPSVAFLKELRESKLLEATAGLARQEASPAAAPLAALVEWLSAASDEALEGARRDFISLFVAAKHLPAPPWESVYVSPDRLVNQEPAREVLRAYAEAGVAFDGWRQLPSDHISLELAFAATQLAELPRVPEARARLDHFTLKHLAVWVPRFCADLKSAATSPLYQHVADALVGLLPLRPEA